MDIIVTQTHQFLARNIRRCTTDAILFSYFSDYDINNFLKQIFNSLDIKKIIAEYRKLLASHDYFILDILAKRFYFVKNGKEEELYKAM